MQDAFNQLLADEGFQVPPHSPRRDRVEAFQARIQNFLRSTEFQPAQSDERLRLTALQVSDDLFEEIRENILMEEAGETIN